MDTNNDGRIDSQDLHNALEKASLLCWPWDATIPGHHHAAAGRCWLIFCWEGRTAVQAAASWCWPMSLCCNAQTFACHLSAAGWRCD